MHEFMVAGLVLEFGPVREIDFVVAQVHITVAQVHGEAVGDVIGHTGTHVPGKVGAVLIEVAVIARRGERVVGVIEGHAQARAHIGREGRAVAEIIVEVQEQRGRVPGTLEIHPSAIVPAFFAVAAQGVFHFSTHGHAELAVEVIAQGQGAAQGEASRSLTTEDHSASL